MKENDPIHIRAVNNGWIITPDIRQHECMPDSETKVFRSMKELCEYIEEHFTHRGKDLESDA